MSKHTTTKAQSELIGLAMVVVLIVIGLLIAVSFGLRSSNVDYAVEHQNDQLPVLLNDAILETHVGEDCYQEQMKKLILKVAQNENFYCGSTPVEDFVKTEIQGILNDTLDSWFITYRYTIYTGLDYTDKDRELLYFTNYDDDGNRDNDCVNQNIKTENFFFSMSNGDFLNMKMDICFD